MSANKLCEKSLFLRSLLCLLAIGVFCLATGLLSTDLRHWNSSTRAVAEETGSRVISDFTVVDLGNGFVELSGSVFPPGPNFSVAFEGSIESGAAIEEDGYFYAIVLASPSAGESVTAIVYDEMGNPSSETHYF